MANLEVSYLERNIVETVTWLTKTNPTFELNLYRSPILRPSSTNDFYHYKDYHKSDLYNVIKKRQEILNQRFILELKNSEIATMGKLICCDPYETECDGGSEFYSQGFFDINEFTPWDTWVGVSSDFKELEFIGDKLISWVPFEHFNKIYSGMQVGLQSHVNWIKKTNTKNSFLNAITGTPEHLEFDEKFDHKEIEIRLTNLNKNWP